MKKGKVCGLKIHYDYGDVKGIIQTNFSGELSELETGTRVF